MQNNGRVQGSKEASAPVIVNHDNVYVHTNVKQIQDEEFPDTELYEYDEIIMTKDEYIVWAKDNIDNLEAGLGELGIVTEDNNTTVELAIAELGATVEENQLQNELALAELGTLIAEMGV